LTAFDAHSERGAQSDLLELVWTRAEILTLLGVLLLVTGAYLVHLGAIVIGNADEGIYIYGGKLLIEGRFPYRDFFLGHPPLIVLFTGFMVWLVGPDIMAVRYAFIVVTVASMVPLYLVTRALARSPPAGLVAVGVYAAGLVLSANMGRVVRLEPLMNAFLIAAFACYVLQPRDLRCRFVMGILFVLAALVKFTAVVPAALLLVGDSLWSRLDRRGLARWAMTACGVAFVLLPAMTLLLSVPGFVDDVFSQVGRPRMDLAARLPHFLTNVIVLPFIPFAFAAGAWFIFRWRDAPVRVISLVMLGSTPIVALAFKTYFHYYLILVLPWIAVIIAVAFDLVVRRLFRHRAAPLIVATALVLAGGVPAVSAEVCVCQSGTGSVSLSVQADQET
jgi:hypothetical protein